MDAPSPRGGNMQLLVTSTCRLGRDWWVVALVASSLLLTVFLASSLERRGSFHHNDILFGDDCASGLLTFTEGIPGYNIFRHPNINYFVGHTVRGLARLSAKVVGRTHAPSRHVLALLVSPLAGALALWILLAILRELEVRLTVAVPLGLLAAVSFSHTMFCSIPTHFSLTAVGILLFYYLYLKTRAGMTWVGHALWLGAGLFAVGITASNALPWLMFYTAALLAPLESRSKWRIVPYVMLAPAVIAVVTIAFNTVLSNYHYGINWFTYIGSDKAACEETTAWLHTDGLTRMSKFPAAFVQTFIPNQVTATPNSAPWAGRFPWSMNLDGPVSWSWCCLGGLLIVLLGLGVYGGLAERSSRAVVALAVGTIVMHMLLISFYGDDTLFLYSQHWEGSAVLLLSGISFLPVALRRFGIVVLHGLVAGTAIKVSAAWIWIERFLSTAG